MNLQLNKFLKFSAFLSINKKKAGKSRNVLTLVLATLKLKSHWRMWEMENILLGLFQVLVCCFPHPLVIKIGSESVFLGYSFVIEK